MSVRKNSSHMKPARTRKGRAARRPETPVGRLHADGASSPRAIRRRLLWLAQEWDLPLSELPEAKPYITAEIVDFADTHNVTLGWIMRGDLRGFQRMVQSRKREIMTGAEVAAIFNALSLGTRQKLSDGLRRIAKRLTAPAAT